MAVLISQRTTSPSGRTLRSGRPSSSQSNIRSSSRSYLSDWASVWPFWSRSAGDGWTFYAQVILLPVSVGLAAASLLFWGFYSPSIGPINPILEQLGLIHGPISFLGTSLSALLSFLDRLKILWLVYAYLPRRAAGHSGRSL
jgi:hypothetical protein